VTTLKELCALKHYINDLPTDQDMDKYLADMKQCDHLHRKMPRLRDGGIMIKIGQLLNDYNQQANQIDFRAYNLAKTLG